MHGLTNCVAAAKRERQVADAPTDPGMGKRLLDRAAGLDERDGVLVVLRNAGRHGKDIGIEDDVFRREADLPGQNAIGSGADLHLAFIGVGLAIFIERHDDDGGAISPDETGLLTEGLLALLQTDRVHDPFTLQALQASLQHGPSGRVDHHGNSGDVGLGGDEIEEPHHRRLGIQHPFVHVDVDHLRAVLHLLPGDLDGRFVVVVPDESGESERAGHVGALSDVGEQRLRPEVERFETGEPHRGGWLAGASRGTRSDGVADRGDMIRCRAATSANDVHETARRKLVEGRGHRLGGFVVLTELVR